MHRETSLCFWHVQRNQWLFLTCTKKLVNVSGMLRETSQCFWQAQGNQCFWQAQGNQCFWHAQGNLSVFLICIEKPVSVSDMHEKHVSVSDMHRETCQCFRRAQGNLSVFLTCTEKPICVSDVHREVCQCLIHTQENRIYLTLRIPCPPFSERGPYCGWYANIH